MESSSYYTIMDVKDAIDEYLKRGFGSMNKNDFEVWIFHQLMNCKYQNFSNYDISIDLRIPETKVKRLKYEAELKYCSKDANAYFLALDKILSNAQIKKKDNKIQFLIEDVSLRKFLDSVLKKHNTFSDTSFNTELVVIDIDDLCVLLNAIYPESKKQDILNKAKDKAEYGSLDFSGILKHVFNSIVAGFGESIGKTLSDFSVNAIINLIN